ncbi:MAG: hypothetical protein HQK98_09930 [Nitrospirae bacterium]|nr:hypothetical protein [Nitrospirota bacterium]
MAWLSTYQNADIILNAPGFNNAGYLNSTNDGLLFNHPMNISTDGTHLLLADTMNNRVLIWNTLPSGNVSPDIVLGQTDFTGNDSGSSLSQLNWPVGVTATNGKVVVADTWNHRILIWNTFPTKNGQSADLYFDNFPKDTSGVNRGFDGAWPWGIWTNGTKLVVSGTQIGKVLIWNTFPTTNNQSPDLILTGNGGQLSGGFNTPRTIGTDGKSYLVIGDHGANPTNMFWNTFPGTDTTYNFAINNPQNASEMMWGGKLTSNGKFVIVSSPGLSIWNNGVPTSSSQSASLFVGRFPTTWQAQYDENCTTDGYPLDDGDGTDIAVTTSGRVYVSLYNGNKVIGYNSIPTYKQQCPDFVIGSPNLATNTYYSNKYIQNPIPATNGTSLVAGSDFDNTISVWKTIPSSNSTPPDSTFTFSSSNVPPSSMAIAVLNNTWAAVNNSQGGEVHIWNSLPSANTDTVFTGGIGTVTFQGLSGIALDNKYLYIADNAAGKIYIWNVLPDKNASPVFTLSLKGVNRISSDGQYLAAIVYTQSNGTSVHNTVNIYQVSSLSSSLNPIAQLPATGASYDFALGPGNVLVSNGHLFIADINYGRVLVWQSTADAVTGKDPDVVLGQPDLKQGMKEAIGKNKLLQPLGLAFANDRLWVSEFKFQSRLLGFSSSTDSSDAASTISAIYAQDSTFFGSKSGDIQIGTYNGSNYYVQWFSNGTALLAWTDGYMYYYYNANWNSFGISWKGITKASSMIDSIYAQFSNFFGTKSGSVQIGTAGTGTYYMQWFMNGTGLLAWTDGYMYYYYNGYWFAMNIAWK